VGNGQATYQKVDKKVYSLHMDQTDGDDESNASPTKDDEPMDLCELEECPSQYPYTQSKKDTGAKFMNELVPTVIEEALDSQIIDHFDRFEDIEVKDDNKAS
jgi:hypothetical protein